MDNLKAIKANIDAAIDAGLGIGGILAVNHNNVLTETLYGAGKYVGAFFNASGALDDLAPTPTFLWNGNDPSTLTNFTVRVSKLDSDLQDVGLLLARMTVDDILRFKDVTGKVFVLKYQSHAATTDPNTDDVYDITVQGTPENTNYIYGPAEIEVAGLSFFPTGTAGGGGIVATVNGGQALTVDNGDPANPIVNLGGVIDDFVVIDIQDPLDNGHGIEISGANGSGDNVTFGVTNEGVEMEAADVSGDLQSNFSLDSLGNVGLNGSSNTSGDQKVGDIQINHANQNVRLQYSNNDLPGFPKTALELYTDELRIITPAVDAGTATPGQVLGLSAVSGEVEFITAGGGGLTKYNQSFVIADFTAGSLTILAATHGVGTKPTVQVFDSSGNAVLIDITRNGSGDVTLTVATGAEFDGEVTII